MDQLNLEPRWKIAVGLQFYEQVGHAGVADGQLPDDAGTPATPIPG